MKKVLKKKERLILLLFVSSALLKGVVYYLVILSVSKELMIVDVMMFASFFVSGLVDALIGSEMGKKWD